jgi:hypothetical protein
MVDMPGSSDQTTRKRRMKRVRLALWTRVGAFVRAPREELGLSPGDVIQAVDHKSRNAVSNVEVGIEGRPPKRAYAWADMLEFPRDPFFHFVTGEREFVEISQANEQSDGGERLTAAESELVASYCRLPPRYQRRLRDQAHELETLPRAAVRPRGQ